MDKPWYRKMFGRSQEIERETVEVRADHGNADAQFSLGFKFANGAGEAPDYVQAAHWYLKAADQSHALAQFNLGVMYAKGQGVLRDDAQAAMWIGKAAHQGDAGAQYHLGMRLHRAGSRGVPDEKLESRLEAYKWLHLAAAQGYKGSDAAFEFVTLGMTREEVIDGNHRAAGFVAATSNHSQVQQG